MRRTSKLISSILLAAVLSVGTAIAANVACVPGSHCEGTDDADTLEGTPEGDQVFGFGGNDTLYGRGGVDYLDGGEGADTIFTGYFHFPSGDPSEPYLANDRVRDRVSCGPGRDEVYADLRGVDVISNDCEYVAGPAAYNEGNF